jgi:hypothetical protein
MHENDHQHKSRGFKLTNFTSFGKSMFSGGFIQKTGKVDSIVTAKHDHPRRNRLRGPPNQCRRQITVTQSEVSEGGAGRPASPTWQPLLPTLVLHHLLDSIYTVDQGWFMLRVQMKSCHGFMGPYRTPGAPYRRPPIPPPTGHHQKLELIKKRLQPQSSLHKYHRHS